MKGRGGRLGVKECKVPCRSQSKLFPSESSIAREVRVETNRVVVGHGRCNVSYSCM